MARKTQLSLNAKAADASVRIDGAVDLNVLRADELRVEADGLDFSKLVEKGPASKLALRLQASGGGTSLESLDGKVELTIPESTLDGQPLGPIELRGTAKEGQFELARLEVKLPGATVIAEGSGTPERLHLSGELRAKNLARLGDTLGRIVDPKGIPLSGNGAFSFVVEGHPKHPGVSLRGRFPSLRYTDIAVRELAFEGTLPDVRRPLDADADLRAGTLQLGERTFHKVRTALVTRGRELSAEVTSEGLNEIELHLRGRVDSDRRGFALADLRLRYPEATWTLERPTRVNFGDRDVMLEELALASSGQRLVVSGGIRGTQLQADARIEQLLLERLPRTFVPESLGLGGALSATVTARGTTRRPRVDAEITLRDGAIDTLRELQLELDAHYANDRAHGELSVRALTTEVKGSFDTPITGLLKGTREQLSLDLAVQPTKLEALFAALGVDPGLTGMAAATVKVTGTAANPHLRIVVDGDEVKHEAGPAGDLDLIVESNSEGKLIARIDLDSMGGQSFLLLDTPFTAGQFLTGPVNGRMFLETPVRLRGSFQEFPVEALAAWGVVDTSLKGKASFTLEATGTPLAPEGKVHLAVKEVTSADLEPMELFGTVTAAGERVQLTVTAMRKQQRVIDLAANVGAGVGEFIRGGEAALRSTTVEVDGDLGPIPLPELQALTGMGLAVDPTDRPSGLVRAKLQVSGTLSDPTATLNVSAEKLGMGKLALGNVALDYTYEDALSRAKMVLTSAKGGALQLEGDTRLDLSLDRVRSGLAWRDAPVKAHLTSAGFDPSFLSNVTAAVRSIAGKVDADAKLSGTLGAPLLKGRVEWGSGRLALAGYGNFTDVHLLVRADNDEVVLEELFARGGAGELKATARARRNGSVFALTGEGAFKDFPIIVDDQLNSLLTGRFRMGGEASSELVSIRDLSIPELHVELPETRRKDLQALDRPDDIVLVRKGVPIYGSKSPPKADAPPAGDAAGLADTTDQAVRKGGLRFTVVINAPKNLWVKGTDVHTEVGLSEGFRLEIADRAMMFGEIRFLRGRVDVLGRRFDVLKDSQVRFAGLLKVPYINITAEHANEREQVNVFATIRGQGKDFTIRVSSQPALSESEIYTLLATGRRSLKRGSGSSMSGGEAATVATAYLASQFKRLIPSKIPLDVSIEAGAEGFADASGQAGMYLTDDLYLGYQLRLRADPMRRENAHSFRLEYQLSPRWSLETQYGDALSGGADLIWSKDY